MLKMLFVRCCCVEYVVTLTMLLRWICCYVEDVVPPTNAFETALWMGRGKTHMCILSQEHQWIWTFCKTNTHENNALNTQFHWFLLKHIKIKEMQHKQNIKTADNITQICCPLLEHIPCFIKLSQSKKHCKTQWKMTCPTFHPIASQLSSGELSALTVYIHTILSSVLKCVYAYG